PALPPLLARLWGEARAAPQREARALRAGLLLATLPGPWKGLATRLGCVALHANHREFDAARVAAIRAAGLRTLAYTVNDPARARELMAWGVDLICTDRIDLIGPDFATAQG
ncbi:glycerophosphodiester phosphodiesterase family protein, partial [Burkholderia sp. Ac-20379]|uniref:glycerophosphodiester phosphodiesterase family protein n=1 Tax=Burkholderia sp. Ac-20379 TaxID=2703900 RepID=UPI001DF34299